MNKEQLYRAEIKEGLRFQLKNNTDRTVFTVHSIIDGLAYVIWPGGNRMQQYMVKDIESKFILQDWEPLSGDAEKDKEIEKGNQAIKENCDLRKEIERLKGLIKDQYLKRISHLHHTDLAINNLWYQFKTENNL